MAAERRGAKRKAADTQLPSPAVRRDRAVAEDGPAFPATDIPGLVGSVRDTLAAMGDLEHAVQAEKYLKGVARRFPVRGAASGISSHESCISDRFFVALYSVLWHLRSNAPGGCEADSG